MISLTQIESLAARHPHRPALRDDSRAVTWQQYRDAVRDEVRKMSHALPSAGEVVLAWAEPSIEYLVAVSALTTLGIPQVAVMPSDPYGAVQVKSEILRPTAVLDLAGEQPALVGARVVTRALLDSFGEESALQVPARPVLGLGFTSGTSGPPKLVMRHTSGEVRRRATMTSLFGFTSDDSFLVTVPLAHASGHGWVRTLLAEGACVRVTAATDGPSLRRIVGEEHITTSLMVPPVLAEYLDALEAAPRVGAQQPLRWVLTGGRHLSQGLVARAHRLLGPDVLHLYYGTTETGVNTVAFPAELAEAATCTGAPLPGSHLIALRPDGTECASFEVGVIGIAGYQNLDEYRGVALETAEIDGRRYVLTSDRGFLDGKGRLHLTSRQDGVSARSSFPLIQLESAVSEVRGVRECAALTQPGELVSCFVVPEVDVDLEDLSRRLRDGICLDFGLDGIELRFVAAVPYGRTGKVDARLLAATAPLNSPAPSGLAHKETESL